MMKWLAHLVIGLCLTCLLSGSAVAAVVVLANGDRLSGMIISETSREITLEHKVLGILKIPRRQLAGPNPIPTEKPSPPAENLATEVENEKTSGRESATEELPNEPLETAEQTGKPAPKQKNRKLMHSPWEFKQHGDSGQWISDLFPNVARHAGADQVDVRLTADSRLEIVITDNGRGFDPGELAASGGLGIAGMRERAMLVGGSLEVESEPGHGTTFRVGLPAGEAQPRYRNREDVQSNTYN